MIKLYHKKLNSLDELRREKALKKVQSRNMLYDTVSGQNKTDDTTDTFREIVDTGIDFLSSKGVADKVIALAIPALGIAVRRLEKDLIKSFAKEFVAGYAKWKAIEIGTKAFFSILRKKYKKHY